MSRHTLPAWYGLGSALRRTIEKNNNSIDNLKRMYSEWPFFRVLVENIQMALAKADLDIAKDYAELVENIVVAK